MKHNTNNSPTVINKWMCFIGVMIILALMMPAVAVSQTAPVLGQSKWFGILAAGAITGSTTVTGNVGTTTGAIDGTILAPGFTVYATGHATVVTANNNFTTAYANALTDNPGGTSIPATFPVSNQGTDALHPLLKGVYAITDPASMTGDLYLSGSASDIFIFKASGTFNTTAGTVIHLANGVVRENIYWLVAGAVTLGAGSSVFEGTILCNTAITVGATAIVHGALLGNGAITVNAASVLPVEMVSFTATANRFNAELRWSTATELNNYGFEIERRQTGNWTKVGFVAGAGTSNSPRDYSYTDNSLSPGRYVYRIKQIDNNGAFLYKASAEVEIGLAAKKFELASNYPNPFNPSTTIQFTLGNDGMTTLQVYNMLGQKVATLFNGNAEAGRMYQVTLDASKLTSGLYIAKLESGNQRMMQKMVLMK